ncbi:hypothetical protein LO762_18445 [Actinocorallia sp. API 0066]|uniref:hypothetical protein n=1 Tax=Actinocorallia sp. API 0066 TaxID=2896846 RepID=UPI001E58D621|nr:hypothetical protein [Actinocorallia sp. API 0066]MCD0451163.1 hypothetical protein [Actinocorallia sp. API 0066]
MTELAWVESPLQLLSVLEARYAGVLGPAAVRVRDGSAALAATAAEATRLGLPPGVELVAARRAAVGRTGWALGDAFSGQAQTALLRSPAPRRLLLVDDGLATLHLLGLLCGPWRQPLVRARAQAGLPRRALGAVAGARLRALAADGRVTVFTGLPVPSAVMARAHRVGISVVRHDFPWLRSLPADPPPDERLVVLGTSLVANGLIDREAYVRWLRARASEEPFVYHPHRRESADVLDLLRADPRVRVRESGLPVELSLRGLTSWHRVVSLPSTALSSLRVLLGGDGPVIEGVTVPSGWWTDRADASLRTHLSLFTVGPEFA